MLELDDILMDKNEVSEIEKYFADPILRITHNAYASWNEPLNIKRITVLHEISRIYMI